MGPRSALSLAGALVAVLAQQPSAAGTACDSPQKIGVEHKLADGSRASIVWNGAGYGFAWVEGDPFSEVAQIYFQRLDAHGNPVGSKVLIDDQHRSLALALVWNDTGYGLAWYENVLRRMFFVTLDVDGSMIEEPLPIVDLLDDWFIAEPMVTWTETEYGVGWLSSYGNVMLTRVASSGIPMIETTVDTHPRVVESLVWNGHEYSMVSRYSSQYFFIRIDADGSLVEGSERMIADGPYFNHSIGGIERWAGHAWNGTGYGVVLSNCSPGVPLGPCDLVFEQLDASGNVLGSTPVATNVESTALTWNGSEYGVLWQLRGGVGTWFARFSALGARLGPDLQVTLGDQWQVGPRLVWGDQEYVVTVEPGDLLEGGSIWLARIGCNCTDADSDLVSTCQGDCDDSDGSVFPGALEINDGTDNQCPGDPGFGAVDETGTGAGFLDPGNKDRYSWAPQAGATGYEVARSTTPDFLSSCGITATADAFIIDTEIPAASGVFYYLNRASSPHEGSWGKGSSGTERQISCP